MMINNVRDTQVFERESVTEARRIGRSKVAESRKRTIQAMEANDRATYEARYAVKVPFTEEMMRSHREDYFANPRATIEDKMAYMATALGYHAGNRPSEGSSNGPLAKDSKGKSDGDHRYTASGRYPVPAFRWIVYLRCRHQSNEQGRDSIYFRNGGHPQRGNYQNAVF
jgi:hypothetical protein